MCHYLRKVTENNFMKNMKICSGSVVESSKAFEKSNSGGSFIRLSERLV